MNHDYCLADYVALLQEENLIQSSSIPAALLSRPIRCLACDSKKVTSDAVFICKGVHFKKEYLISAIASGAILYICEKHYEEVDCAWIEVTDIRRAMSHLALRFFNDPSSLLTIIGITGTKGKSTTAYYLKAILDAYLPQECGILSTIENYDGIIREEAHLTTPETIDLQQHLFHAVQSGISHLVMEVSSQALKYDRVFGTSFHIACFNNIGTDHISPAEHPDFEDYFASKLKIFEHARIACVNTSAAYSERILEAARKFGCQVITFGFSPGSDIYGSQIEKRDEGTFFTVRTPRYSQEICLTMPGLFNVENALSAIAASTALGIPGEYVAQGLRRARAAGRMEMYTSRDRQITVIVDYAHNSMSFEALYRSVAIEYPGKKIITVFGCPGGKAIIRRHDLGQSAGLHSDYVVITEEDTGDEPFPDIAEAIATHVAAHNCEYCIIENRGEAIRHAIMNLGKNSVILITGKGNEGYQKRGAFFVETPSDVDYAKQFLMEYDQSVR